MAHGRFFIYIGKPKSGSTSDTQTDYQTLTEILLTPKVTPKVTPSIKMAYQKIPASRPSERLGFFRERPGFSYKRPAGRLGVTSGAT